MTITVLDRDIREMICIRSRVLRLGYILRTPPSSVKESLVLIILIMSIYPGPGAAGAVTVP